MSSLKVEEQNGYNPDDFENPPNEDYICSICLGVVRDATEIGECGHIFCDRCLRRWLENSSTCPVDRTKISKRSDSVRKSQFVRNRVLNLTMICQCDTKHSVRNLQKHKNECKKEVSACNICQQSVKKTLYDAHFADGLAEHFEILFDRVQKLEGQSDQKENRDDVKSLRVDIEKLHLQSASQKQTDPRDKVISQLRNEVDQLKANLEGRVSALESEIRRPTAQPKSEEKHQAKPMKEPAWDGSRKCNDLEISGRVLTKRGGNGWKVCLSQTSYNSGKHSFEVKVLDTTTYKNVMIGIAPQDIVIEFSANKHLGQYPNAYGWKCNCGHIYHDNTYTTNGTVIPKLSGDVISVTVDIDHKTIQFALNGNQFPQMNIKISGPICPAVVLCNAGDQLEIVSLN